MDLTAEQIWELVKDWPMEAKLRGAYYTPNDGGHICDRECLKMLADTAVYGYVGSGLAWLATNHKQAVLWPIGPEGPWTCSWDRLPRKNKGGPTPLHAVSAAVLAAKGASDA